MATLDELAIKYGSDKSSLDHNYMSFYEKHLPKDPKRILEIGVHKGSSLAMWSKFFPDAIIHGLDLFAEHSRQNVADFLQNEGCENVFLITGNQMDWLLLEELRKNDYDLIIDDGGHLSRAQMISFFGLFNGKHYFIEDLHCCYEPFYQDGLPFGATALGLFNAIHDSGSNLETVTGKNITLIYAP
jgi:hypothetical protein